MTAFTFFGTQLFVIYSGVGHLGLVVASGALAALGFALRQWPWASLAPRTRANAKLAGASVAGAVGMTLVLGLRVSGTAYDPSSPMFWEWLTALGAGAGLVAASYAFGSATTGAVLGRSGAQSAKLPAAVGARDEIQAAVAAYESLKAAAGRLRQAEKEAASRAQLVTDGVAATDYAKAAEAIRHRLLLAEELQTTAGGAVLRLACGAPLRRLLERRPDAALARLNDSEQKTPLSSRVGEAVTAVRLFMGEIQLARDEVKREMQAAPGSIAQRVGLDASERGKPIDAALSQIEATYGRVGHRLEALRLRVGAQADADAAAGAAMALAAKSPTPAKDVVEVALEMNQAEQSASAALTALGAQPERITEVVVQASSALARDSSDDEALAEVIRSVRVELER
jgi:hypothetical protein